MSVQATHPLKWVFAAVLCLCTLVALWATAMSVREQKLAARRGERIQDAVALAGAPARLQLRQGQKLAVEHFTLLFRDGILSVTPFVEFLNLKKGEQRGWQELRLTILEVDSTEVLFEAEIRPGSPSMGDGWFAAIRAGLRVEFEGNRSVTVVSWDPAKPEMKLKIEHGDKAEEQTLGENGQARAFGITVRLEKRGLLLTSR
jgi:hypothetical protein